MSAHTVSKSSKTFFWVAVGATILSILNHAYLLSEHYKLHLGEASGKSLCNMNETFSCAAVAASRYAQFLGVPMALWGIAANLTLLTLILLYPLTDEQKKSIARRNALLVSGFIAATSIVMGGISTLVISRLCPFCILAYGLSFVVFAALWVAWRRPKNEALLLKPSLKPGDFINVLILSAIVFVGAFIVNDQVLKAYNQRDLGPIIREAIQAWSTNPTLVLEPVEPLSKGASSDKAKMTIIEFADFLCPHCKHAAPIMKAFTQAHPDVRLLFMAWPLDGECNSAISMSSGTRCLLARAVYCAQKLGGNGWAAHDFVYDQQEVLQSTDAVRARLPDLATASGTKPDQMISCSDSAEAKSVVEKMAALGTSINVQGTPTVVVNNRKLPYGYILPVLSAIYDTIPSK